MARRAASLLLNTAPRAAPDRTRGFRAAPTDCDRPWIANGADCSRLVDPTSAHRARIPAFLQEPVLIKSRTLQIHTGPATLSGWLGLLDDHRPLRAPGPEQSGTPCGPAAGALP